MENPTGIVVALDRHDDELRATLDVGNQAVCERCAAGKGCGAGLFGSSAKERQLTATVAADLDIQEGDTVAVSIHPGNLLHAAVIVYGVPLAAAGLLSLLAYGMQLGDAYAALVALTGLSLGLITSRAYLARQSCLRRFVPSVIGRLSRAADSE